MRAGFDNRQQREQQYRSILFPIPPHKNALQECFKDGSFNTYDRIFLHVFAPAAVEFLAWVLDQAVRDKKKRLYFLARDGYLMYHAAQKMLARLGYDLELRYLKVSRYSMRTAQYAQMGSGCMDLICSCGIDITFEKIMKRAALTEEEAFKTAELAGFLGKEKQILSDRQILQLKKTLQEIPFFLSCVLAHSRECYEAAAGYLAQEGLQEGVPYAIVDSGWIGTLQQSIEQLIKRPVDGYYFGLYEIPQNADISHYKAFYFMPKTNIRRKVFFSNCLFETVFSAPEGMTMGYCRREHAAETPYFEPAESAAKNPNGRRILRNRELLMQYAEFCFIEKPTEAGVKAIEKLCSLLMGEPELFEAETFGAQLFCDDVLELQMQPAAAKITAEDLKHWRIGCRILIKAGFFQKELKKSAWPEASITLLGRSVKKYLRQERIYKYLVYFRKAFTAR